MTDDRHGPRSADRDPRPESVEAALARALRHGRNAIAEALLAGRALLDAASLALTGQPIQSSGDLASRNEAVRALALAVEGLDTLAGRLRTDDPESTRRLVDALLAALDAEIARWEGRAHSDADARAVLRAFLGLRELLWELGLRPRPAAGDATESKSPPNADRRAQPTARKRARPARSEPPRPQPPTSASAPRRRRRVQRVDVES